MLDRVEIREVIEQVRRIAVVRDGAVMSLITEEGGYKLSMPVFETTTGTLYAEQWAVNTDDEGETFVNLSLEVYVLELA